jgi:hypothetical protein
MLTAIKQKISEKNSGVDRNKTLILMQNIDSKNGSNLVRIDRPNQYV